MSNTAISIQNISFAYDSNRIYDSFSLDVPEYSVFFIMGINGCGKTTLLKIICSFLKVDAGKVLVEGKTLSDYDSKSLAKVIAYVPQTIHLNSDFTVKDYLALGRTPYKGFCEAIDDKDYEIVEGYAIKLGLQDLLEKEFNTLSSGQKQMVAICRALIQETPIIVMDEPMSALDLGKQADFLSLVTDLKDEGKTIILTSHNPNHALALGNKCSVCFIHEKKILGVGDCMSVLTQDNIRSIFGEKVRFDEVTKSVCFDID